MIPELNLIQASILFVISLAFLAAGTWLKRVGNAEAKNRIRLMWLALRGEDYTQPRMDPGEGWVFNQFEEPAHAEDPVLALLVRSSRAEARWYALHTLLNRWQNERHERLPINQDQELDRFLRQQFRSATDEAREAIEARAELTTVEDADSMQWKYVIEDPATGYRQEITMSERDLIRHGPGTETLPPAVQNRLDRFGDQLLHQIETEADLEPRMSGVA